MLSLSEHQQRSNNRCKWHSIYPILWSVLKALWESFEHVGVNQSSGGYYKRIHDYYKQHKPEGSERSQIAIQHRWAAIQKAVNKFCCFKSAVDRRDQSGTNEQDRVSVQMGNELNIMWLILMVLIMHWIYFYYVSRSMKLSRCSKIMNLSPIYIAGSCWRMR